MKTGPKIDEVCLAKPKDILRPTEAKNSIAVILVRLLATSERVSDTALGLNLSK